MSHYLHVYKIFILYKYCKLKNKNTKQKIGIEDELQDGVPESIEILKMAGTVFKFIYFISIFLMMVLLL